MTLRRLIPLLLALAATLGAAAVDTLRVASVNVPSPALVAVASPAASRQAPDGGWPSLYLLHGYGGSWRNWPRHAPLDAIADSLGVVIVCPDGANSWYWDTDPSRLPASRMESYITAELLPLIDSLYHTSSDPARRAVAGFSMGGHGAVWLGARHPGLFGVIGSMSGALDLRSTAVRDKFAIPTLLGRYRDSPAAWQSHSATSLIGRLAVRPPQNLLIECGTEDFLFADNLRFHRLLQSAGVRHEFVTRPGVHDWRFWEEALRSFLTRFPRHDKTGTKP